MDSGLVVKGGDVVSCFHCSWVNRLVVVRGVMKRVILSLVIVMGNDELYIKLGVYGGGAGVAGFHHMRGRDFNCLSTLFRGAVG